MRKRDRVEMGEALMPVREEVVVLGGRNDARVVSAKENRRKKDALLKDIDIPVKEWEEYITAHPNSGFMTVLRMQGEGKYEKLFGLLTDPLHKRHSIAEKVKMCGITPVELLELMQRANEMMGLLKMAEHIPVVMEQQAVNAKTKIVTCTTCNGEGRVSYQYYKESGFDEDGDPVYKQKFGLKDCPGCDGTKLMSVEADGKTVDRALKLSGMLKEEVGVGAKVNTQVNVQVNAPKHEDTVSEIGKIIDAEVLN